MDFYELTMSYDYFKTGKKDEIAYFDMFYRKNPDNGDLCHHGWITAVD